MVALLLTAVAYYVTGRLSLLLAIPPGYATAVWPAAGIALAAVLVGGRVVLPGVFAGSFFINCSTSFDGSDLQRALVSLSIAAAIAGGATVQALLAGALVRRFVGGKRLTSCFGPLALGRERDVGRFLLLGGLLPCLVSASVGVTTLWFAGLVDGIDVAYSFATWWTGDALGSFAFGPIALMCCGRPRAAWRRLWLPVGAPLLVAVGLAVAAFLLANRSELAGLRSQFERQADDVATAVERAVRQLGDDVEDLAALFDSSTSVERDEFCVFASRILRRRPGVKALEWAPRIELAALASGALEQRPWQVGADGGRVPVDQRADYWPVTLLEPIAGNERALGFDLGSSDSRRQAIAAAIEARRPCLSTGIRLVQDGCAAEWGGLAVFPVWRAAEAAPLGVVLAVFRVEDLLQPIADALDVRQIGVQVQEVLPAGAGLAWSVGSASAAPPAPDFAVRRSLVALGREWQVDVTATAAFLSARRPLQSWAILAGGMMFSGLLGLVLMAAAGRTSMVEQQVRERTAALAASVEDHRIAVAMLQRSRSELEEAQTRAHLGNWEYDERTGAGSWSRNTFRLYGRDPDAGVPTMPEFLAAHVHADDREHLFAEHRRCASSGEPREFDFRTPPVDGRSKHLNASMAVVVDPAGGGRRFVGTVLDVTARKEAEARLRASLREKEVMVQEIHHRVKNNLQIVTSLLAMHARKAPQAAAAILRESRDRIRAMAQIHEALYRAKDLSSIDLPRHVAELCRRIVATSDVDGSRIQLDLDLAPGTLTLEEAVPFSLMLNELLSNACKHAFPDGRRGRIRVVFVDSGQTRTLSVADDGIGCAGAAGAAAGMGMQLVAMLAKQIGAGVEIDGVGGTRVEVTFGAPMAENHQVECTAPAS